MGGEEEGEGRPVVAWRRGLGEDEDGEGEGEGGREGGEERGRGSAMEMQIAPLSPVARL